MAAKRVIITGMGGTVAPVLAEAVRARGWDCVRWDKDAVPVDDEDAGRAFIDDARPDWFFHVATGPDAWCDFIARRCAERGIPLLHTGSVSVFSSRQRGPFAVGDTPEPDDPYGRYKLDCEGHIARAGGRAIVARIGWQLASGPGGNSITNFLFEQAAKNGGRIEASSKWVPATSFLGDTASALASLVDAGEPGLYHVDGNPGLTFFEIATRVRAMVGAPWEIVETDTPDMNTRMTDERVRVAPITDRLPE